MRTRWITATLSTLALLMLTATAVAEDIYRWVDENGTVHFGALPPKGVDAKLVGSAPATSAPKAGAGEAQAPDSAFAQPEGKSPGQVAREEREQRARERQQREAELAPQCATMRQQVEEIEPHTRVIVQDEDGSVRRLEDEERLQAVADAKAFIAENCQDVP